MGKGVRVEHVIRESKIEKKNTQSKERKEKRVKRKVFSLESVRDFLFDAIMDRAILDRIQRSDSTIDAPKV